MLIIETILRILFCDLVDCGATQYIRQSPERGGEASYS